MILFKQLFIFGDGGDSLGIVKAGLNLVGLFRMGKRNERNT